MHTDARTLENGTLIEGDLCIVGTGAAGISIARAFSGSSIRVVALESGGFTPDGPTQSLCEGENVGLSYPASRSSRLRIFGGTTAVWAGGCAPLDPIDFQARAWVPYSGWPITREDLDPYYARAQAICQLGAYRYDAEFWEDEKADLVRLPLDASTVRTEMMQFSSPPIRFGVVYRDDLVKAVNINVFTFANLAEIEVNDDASRVTGLRVKCLNGSEHRVRARHYVLACGGIDNPRLLLLSNRVQPHGLGNRHDLVGRFFIDHPRVASAYLCLSLPRRIEFYARTPDRASRGLLRISDDEQRRRQILNWQGLLSMRLRSGWRLDGSESSEVATTLLDMWNHLEGMALRGRDRLRRELHRLSGYAELTLRTRGEQAPNPQSRITLGSEKDQLGLPRARLDWRLTDLDWRTIREANVLIGQEMGRAGLGRLQLADWLTQEQYSGSSIQMSGVHHIGTTRMSTDPRQGVVDRHCRVHGMNNLYIAGSSVFPTSGTAGPTFTLIALALRLSDHLKRKLTS